MNRIEAGKVYTAVRQREGNSANGSWELLSTKDDRGNNDIAVFVANRPSGVKEGGSFRVEKILSVSYGNKKDQNGNWRANISIDAEVTAVESYGEFAAKKEAPARSAANAGPARGWEQLSDDDGELPF